MIAPGDQLAGLRLKRQRAWDLIGSLKADISAFNTGDPNSFETRANFDEHKRTLTVTVHSTKAPDLMWGVRVGEIIHNLRSALDHLVWELFILKLKGEAPPDKSKLQFPICEVWSDFKAQQKPLKGLDARALEMIRSEQPMPTASGGTGEAQASPLWHLRELSNCDKHRTIHLTFAAISGIKFEAPPLKKPMNVEQTVHWKQGHLYTDGEILGQWSFPDATEFPFVEQAVKAHLQTSVAFAASTPAVSGKFVIGTLKAIATRTDRILNGIAGQVFKTKAFDVFTPAEPGEP